MKLGTLWGEIRYRHPYLLTRAIDWDSALVAALPRAEAAPDTASYAAVIDFMLRAIDDPATGLYVEPRTDSPLPRSARPFVTTERGVLIVTAGSATPGGPSTSELSALSERIANAKAAILDLRARPGGGGWAAGGEPAVSKLLSYCFSGEMLVPGSRWAVYSGYPARRGGQLAYPPALESGVGEIVTGSGGHKPDRIAILLDQASPLPKALFALRQQGRAVLLGEGFPNPCWAVPTDLLDAGEGVQVEMRLEEFPFDEHVDEVLPSRTGIESADLAFERALALLRRTRKPVPAPPRPDALFRSDYSKFREPAYPDRAHRQLAAIRLWNVIRLFYPYRNLLEGAWDDALERFLPTFESASNVREYVAAVHRMAALVKDGHTRVNGGSVDSLLGGHIPPPIEVLDIEGKAVVVDVPDSTVTPGIHVGDVIERVDGVPISDRIRAVEPYVTGATPNGMRRRVLQQAVAGADTVVTLTVSGSHGRREVELPRSASAMNRANATILSSSPYRMLPGNVGYVSMRRLLPREVGPMFEAFARTRAIVFDLRGYPNGTAWSIAPYIHTRGATTAALFRRPIVSTDDWQPQWFQFEQQIPEADVPRYKGRTIALIDERAISQSEHTCLFLEAANGTTFVGSPTAGSNGDVTLVALPGALSVTFTGHDVRHADGRQLQRVGIQPDVPVRPTIAGLRAGRDEVLERALKLVKEKRAGS